ncbi:hypothetical protein [Stutzerimonas sp. R75]|uniref:hypothetical protein n=1 Tax=Stutzerimonas sp. R75 TaxID=3439498 RepID=UPI00406C7BCE
MTTTKQHLGRPMIFSQEELDTLIVKAEEQYRNSLQACYRLNKPLFNLFCEELIQLHSEGYSLHPTLPSSTGPGSYNCYLNRPEALLVADIEALKVKVEADYRKSIKDHNAAQVELLTKQLFEAEQAKELKKQEEKEAKQRAQAAAEAQEYFNSLINKETK